MDVDDEKPWPRQIAARDVSRPPTGMAPRRAPLVGRVVRLDPVDPAADAAELYEASHGDAEALRIWDYLPDGPWPDRAGFAGWVLDAAGRLDRVAFTIRGIDTGRACGMAQYLDIQPQPGVIEIGYIWFSPALQRSRGATEALFLMLCHAMDDLGYRRMQWRCNALNKRSRAAARRLGFRFEGIFHNHMIVKGRSRDTAWYSILDHEWPDVRARIAAWLADDNFDADGRARTSLAEAMGRRGEGQGLGAGPPPVRA